MTNGVLPVNLAYVFAADTTHAGVSEMPYEKKTVALIGDDVKRFSRHVPSTKPCLEQLNYASRSPPLQSRFRNPTNARREGRYN